MTKPSCECGHEKRDHRAGLLGSGGTQYGECKVCLCRSYQKSGESAAVPVVEDLERA
jgi:hypothetical protein